MKRISFIIVFQFLIINLFSQTAIIDLITKPSLQIPSFTALQYEQFRSSINYSINSNLIIVKQNTTLNQEINLRRINSGLGFNYNNSSFGEYFTRNFNFTYNYRFSFEDIMLIPGISLDYIKYNQLDTNNISSNINYFSVNSSILLEIRNFRMGTGFRNLNQPEFSFDSLKQVVPIKYQFFASYNFLTGKRHIKYLQLVVYDMFYKNTQFDFSQNVLSTGLNTRIGWLKLGFDVNFYQAFPYEEKFNIDNTNYYIGIEKKSINLLYCFKHNNSNLTNINEHQFTLAVYFNLQDDIHLD